MDYDKLNKRIDHMFKYESDNFFVNINLKNEVSEKLYDYQIMHVFNLMSALRTNNCTLDASDTGTGKTFCALALCKQLNLRPFVICPKTVMPHWRNVCNIFNIQPLGIVNYECIKTGKYYNKIGERVDCNFIKVTEDDINIEFKWNLPKYALLIFDEAHKCKNIKTINAKLLLSAKSERKVLMLSATLSDKPKTFHIFGYMLGCYKKLTQGKNWISGMLLEDQLHIGSKDNYLSAINRYLYPNKGSRMRIAELKDKFPENQVCADAYYLEESEKEKVNRSFKNILQYKDLITSALDTDSNDKILGEIVKARMEIEKAKIPIFEELIENYMENGFAVVVFLNFTDTIKELAKKFKSSCIVWGKQSNEERIKNIDDFQSNKTNLIFVNQAICEGISLHDLNGIPRVSLISPSFSAEKLLQTLGRIHRAGALSPAIQRICFAADTIEESICRKLNSKLQFLATLNDNDLIEIN